MMVVYGSEVGRRDICIEGKVGVLYGRDCEIVYHNAIHRVSE